MTFTLHDVAPWGRNLADYGAMFDLGETERRVSILGVADGPASFNAEGTAAGMRIVSVDPLYAHRAEDIRARIDATTPYSTELAAARRTAMAQFLDDYDLGVAQGRYVSGSAADLPFPDGSYDLALCSHFLFLYAAQQDLAFHLKAVRDMLRVAEEVRIFPLLEPGAVESRHLKAVMMALPRMGFKVERVPVAYEPEPGASEMLKIWR